MSWNLLILKPGSPHATVVPMAPLRKVSKMLNTMFPGLEWPTESRCELNVDRGFSIELRVISGIVCSLYTSGGYDHLKLFAKLCKKNGWELSDCQEGECIDLDDPYGWYEKKHPKS
jgi:hypothetical protein